MNGSLLTLTQNLKAGKYQGVETHLKAVDAELETP